MVTASLDRKTTSREYAIQVAAPMKIKIDVAPVGKNPGVQPTWHITFPSGKQFGAKGYDPFDGALSAVAGALFLPLYLGASLAAALVAPWLAAQWGLLTGQAAARENFISLERLGQVGEVAAHVR